MIAIKLCCYTTVSYIELEANTRTTILFLKELYFIFVKVNYWKVHDTYKYLRWGLVVC